MKEETRDLIALVVLVLGFLIFVAVVARDRCDQTKEKGAAPVVIYNNLGDSQK